MIKKITLFLARRVVIFPLGFFLSPLDNQVILVKKGGTTLSGARVSRQIQEVKRVVATENSKSPLKKVIVCIYILS